MNTFQEHFHLFLQRRCLAPTVLAEADQCYQAGVSGPTMNVQKKLSCQEAETEGQRDLPDLNTEPVLLWFPSLLALEINVETLPFNEGKVVLLL